MMGFYLSIAAGGALGAMSRYWVYETVEHTMGLRFPWATLIVNCLGGFLAGLCISMMAVRAIDSGYLRLFIITGFLGAFTTFSTFAIETSQLLQHGSLLKWTMNVVLNNMGSITLALVGLSLGRCL
jgi:fluoride exporter